MYFLSTGDDEIFLLLIQVEQLLDERCILSTTAPTEGELSHLFQPFLAHLFQCRFSTVALEERRAYVHTNITCRPGGYILAGNDTSEMFPVASRLSERASAVSVLS